MSLINQQWHLENHFFLSVLERKVTENWVAQWKEAILKSNLPLLQWKLHQTNKFILFLFFSLHFSPWRGKTSVFMLTILDGYKHFSFTFDRLRGAWGTYYDHSPMLFIMSNWFQSIWHSGLFFGCKNNRYKFFVQPWVTDCSHLSAPPHTTFKSEISRFFKLWEGNNRFWGPKLSFSEPEKQIPYISGKDFIHVSPIWHMLGLASSVWNERQNDV